MLTTRSRAAVALAFTLAALALAGPSRAAIPLDLSYVDTTSPQWQRFLDFVDEGVAGPPYPYAFSATDAIYAYRVTGLTKYAQKAIALVDAQVLADEATIAGPLPDACHPDVSFDSYLYVGPTLQDLALTLDWSGSLVDTEPGMSNRRTRWTAYASQAIFNVWHASTATWNGHSCPWSGWATTDPGDNYYFSFLTASMYWALAANDTSLISFLESNKLPALVTYYANIPGGGSREGTGYGTAQMNLFPLYRLWSEARPSWSWGGAYDHDVATMDYWIHATVPTLDRFAPIGDQSRVSYPDLYDYQRRLVLEARAVGSAAPAAQRASWWLHHITLAQMSSGFNLRYDLLPTGVTESEPTALWYHATGVGALFARTGWDDRATWLAMVAGPYDQGHAHQDQGSFTLFHDDFLAVTENVFTHSGIEQGTDVHDVLRFENGGNVVPQHFGTSTMSVSDHGSSLSIDADLSPVYDAAEGVTSWTRHVDFDEIEGGLVVHDLYSVAAGVTAIWQIDTPVKPTVNGNEADAGALHIRVVTPSSAQLSVVDWHAVDPSEYLSGWKLEVRGGTGGYEVEVRPSGLFGNGFESGDTTKWSGKRSG
jgi:hypothetical protein